ncbi:MAG TPA: enolase C-terminal domain-like protein [Actinomycetota bacterium]|nr:enolase C-terminal domain-like protein [Actinomycetota bacterium]
MKITGIETTIVRPPIRHPGKLGVGALDAVENVIVRLATDEGIEGVGEASPWPVFIENAHAIKATIDRYLAPALLGASPLDIESLVATMNATQHGMSCAKTGIEIAAWDAAGKALGRPVYELLGGLVRDRVDLSYSVANQNVDDDLAEIGWLIDEGFDVLKIKTGVLDERAEVERIAAIRERVGDDFDMRIDFNQGGRAERAIALCRKLEDYSPTFIEQPVKGWDVDGLARITGALDTPVMADESVMGLEQGFTVVARHAADIVSIKLAKLGGILRSKKLAAVCEAAAVPCYAGAMWESGIGIAASLHFACSSPAVTYGSDFYTCSHLMTDDLIEEPLTIKGGDMLVPHGPGLGVTLDTDALERYRID